MCKAKKSTIWGAIGMIHQAGEKPAKKGKKERTKSKSRSDRTKGERNETDHTGTLKHKA
jgi:hypothetical protein